MNNHALFGKVTYDLQPTPTLPEGDVEIEFILIHYPYTT
jgi:hypothetical protein